MSLMQAVLSGVFISLALALVSAFVYMTLKERSEGPKVPSPPVKPSVRTYMEVWQCPHCQRLSRIARQCKWCMKEMPPHPKFLTVPEREYTEQFLLPSPQTKRNLTDRTRET